MIFKYYSKAVGDYCAEKGVEENGAMKSSPAYSSIKNTFG